MPRYSFTRYRIRLTAKYPWPNIHHAKRGSISCKHYFLLYPITFMPSSGPKRQWRTPISVEEICICVPFLLSRVEPQDHSASWVGTVTINLVSEHKWCHPPASMRAQFTPMLSPVCLSSDVILRYISRIWGFYTTPLGAYSVALDGAAFITCILQTLLAPQLAVHLHRLQAERVGRRFPSEHTPPHLLFHTHFAIDTISPG